MIRVFEALQTQVKEVFKKQPNLQYHGQIKFKKNRFLSNIKHFLPYVKEIFIPLLTVVLLLYDLLLQF